MKVCCSSREDLLGLGLQLHSESDLRWVGRKSTIQALRSNLALGFHLVNLWSSSDVLRLVQQQFVFGLFPHVPLPRVVATPAPPRLSLRLMGGEKKRLRWAKRHVQKLYCTRLDIYIYIISYHILYDIPTCRLGDPVPSDFSSCSVVQSWMGDGARHNRDKKQDVQLRCILLYTSNNGWWLV